MQPLEALRSKYALHPADLLGKGMEAEAYAYQGKVLKLYTNDVTLQHLQTLQDFYAGLGTGSLSYQLPYIHKVWPEDGVVLSLEKRLEGSPLSSELPGLSENELDAVFQRYVEAILELQTVHIPSFERYKLYDSENLSLRDKGDFHRFLLRYLDHCLKSCKPYLQRDVTDLPGKLEHLRSLLAQPYTGQHALVHGDFFPANLLVDNHNRITALIDFGWMTHYGDPLYDLATGWVFFDMYDELGRNVLERLGQVMRWVVGQGVEGALYCYILLYSVFTATAYAYEGGDGHYWWCVSNLNNPAYWAGLR